VFINSVVGFLAIAIGFGNFAGLPNQVVVVQIVSGLCLLFLVAYGISSITSGPRVHKRGPNNHRPGTRPPR